MQKSGFPKMRHYVGFWQIGSHIENPCSHTMLINHKLISATKIIYVLLYVMLSRIVLVVLVRLSYFKYILKKAVYR